MIVGEDQPLVREGIVHVLQDAGFEAVERYLTSIFDKLGLHQSPDQHRRVLTVLTYLRA